MASSASGTIRKRPIVTYSKKSRTYLDRHHSDRPLDERQQSSKRVRLSPPEDRDDGSNVAKEESEPETDTCTPDTSHDNVDDEVTDECSSSASSTPTPYTLTPPPSTLNNEPNKKTSTSAVKSTSFTLSTRRKPLFKRTAAAKASDSNSPPPSSSSSSRSSSASKVPSQVKLVQMQIDLDGIGAPKISCKECGMQYVPSAAEDAKLHKRYHAQVVEGLEFGNARGEGIVWSGRMGETVTKDIPPTTTTNRKSTAGKSGTSGGERESVAQITKYFTSGRGEKTVLKKAVSVERASLSSSVSSGMTTCHVVEVTRRSTPSEKKKAVEFLRFANKELSAQEVPDNVLWGPSSSNDGSEVDRREQFKIYLYVEGTKCIGLCLAERIKEAQRATIPDDHNEETGSISCSLDISSTKQPAFLGISRIWTSPKHRRHGIASRLVNCAVESFVYGMKVETEKVAFSQPTDSGAWFAVRWVEANREFKDGGEVPETEAVKRGFSIYFDSV
ncbi:hypothetical protein AA313_de0209076 [Arthrobotrys entomopaga]|nr:hypothetical protein AA313_de0209076 [Arthrobotrys entomopaga]